MIRMSTAVKILLIVGLLGPSYCYDVGVQYVYNYNTQVSTGEDCPKSEDQEFQIKNAGFQVKSSVHITCVWENEQNKEQKLIKIEFTKPSLFVPKKSSYDAHSSKLESLSQSPFYVEWVNGEVKTAFGDTGEDTVLKNLKKGIASFLQVKAPASERQEDVSGGCHVQVEAHGRFIKKKKENCFHPAASKFHYGSSEIRSANVTSLSETKLELVAEKSNFVLSAEGTDYFRMQSNMWKRPEVCVYSKTSLSLESESSGASTLQAKSFSEAAEISMTLSDGRFKQESIMADIVPKKCGNSCKDLPKVISGYKESLSTKNLAKLKSASSFLKLLEIFRLASKEDILTALKNEKFKSVLPQLIDVIAYAGSQSSLHASVEAIDIFSDESDVVERLLLALCTSSHPDVERLQKILGVVKTGQKSKKIHDTLVTALGALVRSYTRRHEEESAEGDKVVQDVEKFFIQQLKVCKVSECEVIYLRGLRNAALPSSLNVLLKYAVGGGKPALEALLALRNIDPRNFGSEAVEVFEEIFHQVKKKHISSSRAIAAELLLMNKRNAQIMKGIIDELTKPGNPEFTSFVSSKINNIINSDEKLRSEMKAVLASEGVNYHSYFLKGSSVSYTKPLIDAATGTNATYGIEMEMLPGRNLKRSSFDVNLFTPESNLHVLSVGMYSEGLSSLGGTGESTDSEDEGDATAGMELTVLGVALRPYVFFEGTSQLISLVWSGVGSKPTPALQGNMLLIDDSAMLIMQNGLPVDLKLKGVLSADLSASIEVSMWYKTSHSVVNNAVALLVKGSANVETNFINLQGEFSFMGVSALDFITDSDFSDAPFKMCLQMMQPEFLFRNNFLTTEQIPGSKYSVKMNKKRKLSVPAVSFYLHPDNNEQCASLLRES